MKHSILKFIKLWKSDIRKTHYIINLSSPTLKQFKTCGFRNYSFKKSISVQENAFIAEWTMSFHNQRSELKIQYTLWNKLQQDLRRKK